LCYGLSDLNRSTRHTSVAVVVAAVQHGPVRGLRLATARGRPAGTLRRRQRVLSKRTAGRRHRRDESKA
jgi:hypothetical protein